MPRQPRLDTPGALHHVMGRGIDGIKIFRNRNDGEDFLNRLANLCENKTLSIYAWALMDNHFHLLVRTGNRSLSDSMRKLLTGYVVNYNRRYKRFGHLFQNRYKSILCEDDPYLLELTRYIHLNPLRADIVKDMKELRRYEGCGHSAIVETIKRPWQDSETVLAYFGKKRKEAVEKYEQFVEDGIESGNRLDLVGGGLIRSLGGWSQVLSLKRAGSKIYSDERILGGSDFVENAIREAEKKEKETLRLNRKLSDLISLAGKICDGEGVRISDLCSGTRKKDVVRSRRIFCQLSVKRMRYPGAEIARFLGITTSAVNRLASSVDFDDLEKYL